MVRPTVHTACERVRNALKSANDAQHIYVHVHDLFTKYLNILHVTMCTIHLSEQAYKIPKTHKC